MTRTRRWSSTLRTGATDVLKNEKGPGTDPLSDFSLSDLSDLLGEGYESRRQPSTGFFQAGPAGFRRAFENRRYQRGFCQGGV